MFNIPSPFPKEGSYKFIITGGKNGMVGWPCNLTGIWTLDSSPGSSVTVLLKLTVDPIRPRILNRLIRASTLAPIRLLYFYFSTQEPIQYIANVQSILRANTVEQPTSAGNASFKSLWASSAMACVSLAFCAAWASSFCTISLVSSAIFCTKSSSRQEVAKSQVDVANQLKWQFENRPMVSNIEMIIVEVNELHVRIINYNYTLLLN